MNRIIMVVIAMGLFSGCSTMHFVNGPKSENTVKREKLEARLNFEGLRGAQNDLIDHPNFFRRSFTGLDLTRHPKLHFLLLVVIESF